MAPVFRTSHDVLMAARLGRTSLLYRFVPAPQFVNTNARLARTNRCSYGAIFDRGGNYVAARSFPVPGLWFHTEESFFLCVPRDFVVTGPWEGTNRWMSACVGTLQDRGCEFWPDADGFPQCLYVTTRRALPIADYGITVRSSAEIGLWKGRNA